MWQECYSCSSCSISGRQSTSASTLMVHPVPHSRRATVVRSLRQAFFTPGLLYARPCFRQAFSSVLIFFGVSSFVSFPSSFCPVAALADLLAGRSDSQTKTPAWNCNNTSNARNTCADVCACVHTHVGGLGGAGMYPIAWAFLKPIGEANSRVHTNTGDVKRIQLYKCEHPCCCWCGGGHRRRRRCCRRRRRCCRRCRCRLVVSMLVI